MFPKRNVLIVGLVLLFLLGGSGVLVLRNHFTRASTNRRIILASTRFHAPDQLSDPCPLYSSLYPDCLTPHSLRQLYGAGTLIQRGYSGKGQTIVLISLFGSPTLQQDIDVFDLVYKLPSIHVRVLSVSGLPQFDSNDQEMVEWAISVESGVETIHAIAPGANIIVVACPPLSLVQFRQVEQQIIEAHLGTIILHDANLQNMGVSNDEVFNAAGRKEVARFDAMLQDATLHKGMTFLIGSGDAGAYQNNVGQAHLSEAPSFPTDDPWMTVVGGTDMVHTGETVQEKEVSTQVQESGAKASGGGLSAFFATPAYQRLLPQATQVQLHHWRGIPDVAADATVYDGLVGYISYIDGRWSFLGGTSISMEIWGGLLAIANQMAGAPLGFVNTALYQLASSPTYHQDFYDITTGTNDNGKKGAGYPAHAGWDEVTGLGTPNAAYLLANLISVLHPER